MEKNLNITIQNKGALKASNYFTIILLFSGLLMILLFIYNTINNGEINWIKILFTIFGIGGLIAIYRQAGYFLIPLLGYETLKYENQKILYEGNLKILKRKLKISCNEIKKVNLLTKERDNYVRKNHFFEINYGLIVIHYKNIKSLEFGHSLEKEELLELRMLLEKYCS